MMKVETQKLTKYGKQALSLIERGYSVEQVVSWWKRLVNYAEVKDGMVIFYLAEWEKTGKGCMKFVGSRVELEIPVW